MAFMVFGKLHRKSDRLFGFSEKNFKSIYFWLTGFIAFLWVLFRSGMRPQRLIYPCQQVAFPLASSWFLAMAAFFGGTMLMRWLTRASALTIVLLAAGIFSTSFTESSVNAEALPVWKVSAPISKLYVLDNIPLTPGSLAAGNASVPDSFLMDPAMDTLLQVLESGGEHFYQTALQTGMIRSDHVVVVKGNFQWAENLGTNTDRIKGLIWRILQHPDGFSGEILVCDNNQGTRNFSECNNSEDTDQSIVDMVSTFTAKGYPVHLMAWSEFMTSVVNEYADGDTIDGFPYDTVTKVSYPKFMSPEGTCISLKHGIWNRNDSTYDRSGLFLVNFPVIKAHGGARATLGIKNWVGVMTTAFEPARYGGGNAMHLEYIYGPQQTTAKVMAETFPDLTIIDGTWTAPVDNYIPSERNRVRTDVMVASTDPVAASWYAAKYVLTPVASWPQGTDPDEVNGYGPIFRGWSDYLINAGYNLTYDTSRMSVYSREWLDSIKVSSILVQGAGGSISINEDKGTLQMSESVLPEYAPNKLVTWSVINGTGQATISSTGLLQAISDGEVMVVATANDGSGVSGSLQINLSNQHIPVSSISLTGDSSYVEINRPGDSLQIYASILPANATDTSFTWSVINGTGRASINATGMLYALADGSVTVLATANDGSNVQGDLLVTISSQVLIEAITVETLEGVYSISEYGGQLQMMAHIIPDSASNKNIHWSVMPITGEGSINQNGLLTALTDGTLEVFARADDMGAVEGSVVINITGQVTTSVLDNNMKEIQISPNPAGDFIELQIVDEKADIQYLSIISMTGQVQKSTSISSDQFRLDIRDLQNGLYIFQFFNSQKTLVETQKILVQQ